MSRFQNVFCLTEKKWEIVVLQGEQMSFNELTLQVKGIWLVGFKEEGMIVGI